ncbi:hypothetical protein B9Z19DRAFT_1127233 [Tuber borchii]|uniref:Uncharacterized protein n=1 Tax=Tuber borchii TaxID=42251 RepID=A0A2T6ZRU4_TUBBO|nr:hypothetical protein B9Z19DRAFT_1127233 [Tuber borchii]
MISRGVEISIAGGVEEMVRVSTKRPFPTYTYNKASSTLTIQCSPSPIHKKAISLISTGFILARDALSDDIQSKIDIVTNEKFDNFHGRYSGSEKIPDLAIQVANNFGVSEPRFILEVGLSETYEKLVQDAELWLYGSRTVNIVMLIKLQEDPSYSCPTRDLTDSEFKALGFPLKEEINEECFVVTGEYGPARYKDLIWVGGITGFVELWGIDEASGVASAKGDPGRINLLNADKCRESIDKHVSMSNFVAGNEDPIHFNWGTYLKNLKRFIKQLAASRCRTTLKDRDERTNAADYDFVPPSPASSFSSVLSSSPMSSP